MDRYPYSTVISNDRAAFQTVQAAIGWHVLDEQWDLLQQELIPDSMVFMWCDGEPAAVASTHQGKGMGKVVCLAVINQMLTLGRHQIFGSTQDERLAALKIYLDMGFHPVYRPEKTKRWESICQKLDKPFAPLLWGWPILTDG